MRGLLQRVQQESAGQYYQAKASALASTEMWSQVRASSSMLGVSVQTMSQWHCDRVVRHSLIGRLQLCCKVDAALQLLHSRALVTPVQLVAASLTAWAAVLCAARRAEVAIAKLRARRCLDLLDCSATVCIVRLYCLLPYSLHVN
jgi:hypothetical protein